MNIISETLQTSRLGQPQVCERLTVVPIVNFIDSEPEYITLETALKTKVARFREKSSATVPEILFQNSGKTSVLLLDGEELIGAKQNRVLNMTILAPAKSKLTIPVSCVERGRWDAGSPDFSSADNLMFWTVRMQKTSAVSRNLATDGTRASNQLEVWNTLQRTQSALHVSSATGAMRDIFKHQQRQIARYLKGFTLATNTTGAVFFIDERPVGVELFDHPATFSKVFPKLIRSYALETFLKPNSIAKVDFSCPSDAAQQLLDQTSRCAVKYYPAIGEGTDIRLHDLTLVGAALKAKNRLVHLCAFLGKLPKRIGARPKSSRAPILLGHYAST